MMKLQIGRVSDISAFCNRHSVCIYERSISNIPKLHQILPLVTRSSSEDWNGVLHIHQQLEIASLRFNLKSSTLALFFVDGTQRT